LYFNVDVEIQDPTPGTLVSNNVLRRGRLRGPPRPQVLQR
jgi:hypothetical protein